MGDEHVLGAPATGVQTECWSEARICIGVIFIGVYGNLLVQSIRLVVERACPIVMKQNQGLIRFLVPCSMACRPRTKYPQTKLLSSLTSMDRPPTWGDFLNIRFKHHVELAERSRTNGTAPYSAITSPPAERFLRQSGPDPTIVPRILASFRSLLEEKEILDQPLPAGLAHLLERFQRDLSTAVIYIEAEFLQYSVFPIVQEVVEELTDQAFTVKRGDLFPQYEQQGERDWITVAFPTLAPAKSMGTQAKRARVLFQQAKDLQEEHEYEPFVVQHSAKAICSKVTPHTYCRLLIIEHSQAWLQLSACDPASEYGVLFSGLSAIVLERGTRLSDPLCSNAQFCVTGLYTPNHHALHVSPHYHVFRDDDPPTHPEYEFINELNLCEKGIPLLAVMSYILLPCASVRQDVQPAIRNPVTEKAAQSSTRRITAEMEETRTTQDGASAGVRCR